MKVGDLVRLKQHNYLAIVVEVGEEEALSDGDYLPAWALVEWVNHPRLSTYQTQWDLEVVNESR
jgi:hypothetical protein